MSKITQESLEVQVLGLAIIFSVVEWVTKFYYTNWKAPFGKAKPINSVA